ncbi:hypothetical protein AXFE_17240 [Acidithrix ferrooxidans]|uniref:Uncharacterized protein n=1 Tax=Acidithrix ferrooxidans TaxID=1280514 RepID=A0A0D8HI18_9ACTN|nr:hypothetical protein AXFE_17240 [Acidithrix ferrooxidans]
MAGVYDVGSLEIIIFGFCGFFCNSEIDYFVKASLFDDLAMVLTVTVSVFAGIDCYIS